MNEQIITTTEATTEVTPTERKPKYKRKRKTTNHFKVKNSYLLYRIADFGILHKYLHGIGKDADGNKVFYFDRHKDVEEVINSFDESEFDG